MSLIDERCAHLKQCVLASYGRTADARLRTLLEALTEHLFAFVQDTRLTQPEWQRAMQFLTAAGQASSAAHQELILLSDVLGLSSLVELVNQSPVEATVGTVLGPVYRDDSPARPFGASMIEREDGGPHLEVRGTVRDAAARPVGGATLDVWGCASNGLYPCQDPLQPSTNLRGVFTTGADGRYAFTTLRPMNYSVPTGGPVGQLLRATTRPAGRAAHLHFWVRAPGCQPLITHLFDAASSELATDAVFSVSDSLTRDMAGGGVTFDITLAPAAATEPTR